MPDIIDTNNLSFAGDMPSGGGGAGGGGGGDVAAGIGAAISGVASVIDTVKQNQYNKEAVANQNWYNAPVNQLARYQAAGLNPNLIYGSGSSSAGNQAQPVEQTFPSVDPIDKFTKAFALMQLRKQSRLMDLDATQKEANILRTYSDTKAIDAKTVNELLQGEKSTSEKEFWNRNATMRAYNLEHQARLSGRELDKGDVRFRNLDLDRQIKEQILRDRGYQNKLQEMGLQKNDNIFMRAGWTLFGDQLKNGVNKYLGRPNGMSINPKNKKP